jgi:hypothetical protein
LSNIETEDEPTPPPFSNVARAPPSGNSDCGSEPSKGSHIKREKQNTADTAFFDGEDQKDLFCGSDDQMDSERRGAVTIGSELSVAESHDDRPQENLSCGRGIKKDWNRTVGSYWREEMTNFNQKTIAVTLKVPF